MGGESHLNHAGPACVTLNLIGLTPRRMTFFY